MPKARQVYLVEVAPDGMVHGLASGSVYFVFDPHRRRVIHRADLARYGGLVHNGLALGADGMLYVLLTKSILRIDPRSRRCTKLADAPGAISAGIAIQAGRIYFGCGSHLWSVAMPSRSATSRAARD